jgi:small-conductance mechanosensitive channel
MKIKQIKEKIQEDEERLQRLTHEMERICEDTELDVKDPSYLVEKTMRFELVQKNIREVFSIFKTIIEDYKKLCFELEELEE